MKRNYLIILIILVLLLGGAVGYTISRGITPEEAESISESRNAENLPSASVISDEEAAKITASITLKQDASEQRKAKPPKHRGRVPARQIPIHCTLTPWKNFDRMQYTPFRCERKD